MINANEMNSAASFITDKVTLRKIAELQGEYFKHTGGMDPEKLASDLINPLKAIRQAHILQKFISLKKKRILEVGSGLGMNLIVWAKEFCSEVYGVDPDTVGFTTSSSIARDLFKKNCLEPSRIIPSTGEMLPFYDSTFDVVFSANSLEHTAQPAKVIEEALRVLKPSGVMQFVYPNYHSFFDGHYAVFHPPVFFRAFFPWYVKTIWRRDPSFAKTLRTELNVVWTQKTISNLKEKYDFEVLSLGEEVFQERMSTIDFEAWAGLAKVKKLVTLARACRLHNLAASIMLRSRTWTPIILTIRKNGKL